MLTVQGIPAFDDNYIWLIGRSDNHNDNHNVAIVDPGDAEPVIAALEAQGLTPTAILITHHHYDHTGGISDLLKRYHLPVFGPAKEDIPQLSQPLNDGDSITIPGLDASFEVMDVSGHTRGHIAYFRAAEAGKANTENKAPALLFCGDTLFAAGCGRVFEGTAAQMQTAMQRIRALPDDTRIYCAHEYTAANLGFARIAEPDNIAIAQRQQEVQAARAQGQSTVPSTLAEEKATNPFLRWDAPQLIRNAETFAGHTLATPTAIFATVRHWKDTLD